MIESLRPWEKMDGEPEVAYSRFVIFLNLGPKRTLQLAQAAIEEQKASEAAEGKPRRRPKNVSWRKEYVRWDWRTRALAWDREQFRIMGERGFLNFAAVLGEIGQTILNALPECKPKSWRDLIRGLNALAKILPTETFAALMHAASNSYGLEPPQPVTPLIEQSEHQEPGGSGEVQVVSVDNGVVSP